MSVKTGGAVFSGGATIVNKLQLGYKKRARQELRAKDNKFVYWDKYVGLF